jgi:predicted hydrocarbon binding protein
MPLSAMLQKLLFVNQFSIAKGKIEILGNKYVMLDASNLVVLQEIDKSKMYASMKKTAKSGIKSLVEHAEVYKGLKDQSLKNIAELSKKIGETDEGTIKTLEAVFETYGLGEMEIIDLNNKDKTAKIKILGSTMALEHLKKGKSKTATCSLTAGIIAGIFSFIFNKDVDCTETSCLAKGNGECFFEVE